jgi:nitrous oxide reductase accessory protein NosL
MFKVLSSVIIAIFFAACGSQKEPRSHHHSATQKMFQSVAPKDATLLQSGEGRESCPMCGMNLVKFYKTSHGAQESNKKFHYCSLHCLTDHLDSGKELKNPTVVDVTSLKMISVMQAYYVVGSSVKGTMSRVSKYAFQNLNDAKIFQKEHGGKIMDFQEALEVAREDFK